MLFPFLLNLSLENGLNACDIKERKNNFFSIRNTFISPGIKQSWLHVLFIIISLK